MSSLVVELCALTGQPPSEVWRMTLSEATAHRTAALRAAMLRARLTVQMILAPLLGREAQYNLEDTIETLLNGGEPLTLEEKYGEETAAEFRDVIRRQRKWLEERRKKP